MKFVWILLLLPNHAQIPGHFETRAQCEALAEALITGHDYECRAILEPRAYADAPTHQPSTGDPATPPAPA